MTPGGLTLCQLPRLSWWLPPLLPLSPLTPPLLSGCQGGVALSADVPRPAWRPLGSTASVSISHLYGFKRHRTDLYFTWEDTIRPGCGPRGRVGSASAHSPGPAASVFSLSRRTEQKEASGFTGPRSVTKLGLDPGAGVRSTPTAAPTAALGCTQCLHPWGISEQEFTPPVLEPHRGPSPPLWGRRLPGVWPHRPSHPLHGASP